MARYEVQVSEKGLRQASVEAKAREAFGSAFASVRLVKLPSSRSERLAEAASQIEEGTSEIESIRDELQEWYDNLPENFQSGEKGEALQAAIDELETMLDALQGIDASSVEFPGMY